jgi:hypothetical protein
LLDESREPEGAPFPDSVGTVIMTIALVLLALGIVQSSEWGWSNARTIGALLTGETAVRDVRWTSAASRMNRPGFPGGS